MIPFESSGTLSHAAAAEPGAEFVTANGLEVHIETVDHAGDSTDLPLIVLLITGDADTVVPTRDTQRLATELFAADLVVIARSGHLPHEENPDLFVDAVLDWLDLD